MLVPCLLMRALKRPHLFEEQADIPVAVTCESCWIVPSILMLSVTLKPPSIHLSMNKCCCLTPSWSVAIHLAFIVSK